ncbi:MAG: efflux RND transporter periplasmic adaptor subunit [Patescibacteria group bacterium]|jgi:RND family efflux transporter MFP subunit
MTFPKFLTKKRIIITIILLVVGYGIFALASGGTPKTTYETAPVEKKTLLQTVEVTGELKPAARVELSFKSSGIINSIGVRIGDKVQQGDVLATLDADDVMFASRSANASLAIAQANLDARLAGETTQSIRVAEASVSQAQASYDKAVGDLSSTKLTTSDSIRVAELSVQTAKNNLDNQDATVSNTIQNAYDSARASLLTALGPLQTALTDGDQITGVDDTAANASFLSVLGFLDFGSLERAKNSYLVAKAAKITAETQVKSLTSSSSKEDIQAAGASLSDAIGKMQTYLTDVQKVLAASLTSTYFTQATLDSKKATIDADRVSVSAQNSTVLTALQTIRNAELSRSTTIDQLQDAYTTALTNLETAKTNATTQARTAETNIEIQKAALDSAKASLDLKKAPPRSVDLAGLRASVVQAAVNAEKATNDLKNVQIIAPVDGTVSEVVPDAGELVQGGVIAIRLVGTEQFDVEALVPEADIAKVEVGQTATMTLDAYGDDVEFAGTVIAEDPDQTKVQDAVYYKIRVQIDPKEKDVKPGMTANVIVTTDKRENTLVIPLRAVRTKDDGTKIVRVMNGETPEERVVELGLRGDEGRVEITKGLNENELVVTGETTTGVPQP